MKIRGSQSGCRGSRTSGTPPGDFPARPPSIPLILTGRYYDNAVPFQDFVKSTFKSASLPQQLKAANYHVYYNNLYYWPSLYADPSIASHVLEKTLRWHDAQSRRWASGLMLLGRLSEPSTGRQTVSGGRRCQNHAEPGVGRRLRRGDVADGPARARGCAGRRRHRLLQSDDVAVIGDDEDPGLQVLPSLGHSRAFAARREPAVSHGRVHARKRQAPGEGNVPPAQGLS